MKKILAMAAAALLISSSAALAAGTATLTVTASVQGTCAFDTATGTLAFPPLDPAVVADVSAATTLSFTCSNGTSYTITDDTGGAPALTSTTVAPAVTIPYSLTYVGNGVATGVSQNLAISGIVTHADFNLKAPDAYTDTVVFTINP